MSQQEVYTDLCRKCYIKINKPTKSEIKKMVMSDEKYQCNCCKKTDYIIEYVED